MVSLGALNRAYRVTVPAVSPLAIPVANQTADADAINFMFISCSLLVAGAVQERLSTPCTRR